MVETPKTRGTFHFVLVMCFAIGKGPHPRGKSYFKNQAGNKFGWEAWIHMRSGMHPHETMADTN